MRPQPQLASLTLLVWRDYGQRVPEPGPSNAGVLADLHSVDYKAVGLDGSDGHPAGPYGKTGNPGASARYIALSQL